MSWTNRVVWQEGMFLRTQHFQQQDRWTEQLVRGRVQAIRPHPWGLVDYALDRDLLGTGRFALASAAGVFEDGTPFALPGEADAGACVTTRTPYSPIGACSEGMVPVS